MKKKLLALFLACIMLLSLIACAAETANEPKAEEAAPEETKTEETKSEASKAEETKAEEAPAETEEVDPDHPNWLCKEKTTLTMMTFDGVTNSYLPPSDDVYYWQWMEDQTNVHIEWDISPYANYSEIASARLAAGVDLADIIHISNYDPTMLSSLGEQGLIVNLADYWDTCFTNTDAYWKAHDMVPYMDLTTNSDGTIWGVFTVANPTNNRITALWNKPWLEKLGLEVPETLEEFYDVLVKMKEAGDVNGNGEADEIPLTSADMSYVMSFFAPAFNLHEYEDSDYSFYWENGDGVMFDERTSDEMKDALGFIHKLYAEGLFDPEVLAMSWDFDSCSQKSSLSRYGCIIMYYSFAKSYGQLINKYYDENDDGSTSGLTFGPNLKSEYNNNTSICFKDISVSAPTIISNNENKELAMKWLDFAYASEAALRERCYGPEGIGYEFDANGDPQLIYDADGNWINVNDYGCGQVAMALIQTDEQLLNQKKHMEWYMTDLNKFNAATEFLGAPVPRIPMLPEEQEIVDLYGTDITTYWTQIRNQFINGEADIDTDWENYVNTMKAYGADEVTNAYQQMYDRTH